MWIPKVDDVIVVHQHLTDIFQKEEDPISPPGIKNLGLLESACSRPHTGTANHDKYPNLELKLAALFHSLTKNHAFHNGNKRTALATLLSALSRNDRRLNSEVSDEDVFNLVVSVTADTFPRPNLSADQIVHEIAQWLKANSMRLSRRPSDMRMKDFVDSCIAAGAEMRKSHGGSNIISTKHGNIRISRATRKLDGAAVRTYMRILGLGESKSGVTLDEFQDGVSDDRAEIYRYLKAMRELAKT